MVSFKFKIICMPHNWNDLKYSDVALLAMIGTRSARLKTSIVTSGLHYIMSYCINLTAMADGFCFSQHLFSWQYIDAVMRNYKLILSSLHSNALKLFARRPYSISRIFVNNVVNKPWLKFRWRNSSEEFLYCFFTLFTAILVLFCILLKRKYLRNRKHVPCFYRVIETRVEVWENEKCWFFEFSQIFTSVSITR